MNAAEAGKLLAFAALYDNRTVGNADVIAWLKAIGDLPYADAENAVAAYYGSETEDRIMPGHVRQRVNAARRERIERQPAAPPPAELADDPGRYKAALQAGVRRIADGFSLRRAIEGSPLAGEPPAEWQRAREALRKTRPPRTGPETGEAATPTGPPETPNSREEAS